MRNQEGYVIIEITLTHLGFNNRRSAQFNLGRKLIFSKIMHARCMKEEIARFGGPISHLYSEIRSGNFRSAEKRPTETPPAARRVQPRSVKSGMKLRCNRAITIRCNAPNSIITSLPLPWVQRGSFVRVRLSRNVVRSLLPFLSGAEENTICFYTILINL